MNIHFLTPKIAKNGNPNSNVRKLNSNSLNYNSYPNLRPLEKDTVSFGTKVKRVGLENPVNKTKVFEEWDPEALLFQDIMEVTKSFEKPVAKLYNEVKRIMKRYGLIASDTNPNGPIMPGNAGIRFGVKGDKSTAIKANSRKLFTREEIERMGDVGRGRIVLRSAKKEEVALIFEAFEDLLKKGYKIKEVENYRLNPKTSYVSQNTLDDFDAMCQKYGQFPEIKSRSLPNGYTAIHLTIELPDGKLVEIQIMGRNMENVKEVEDFFYKWRCEKDFADEYKPIQDVFEEHMPKLDDFQKEALDRYHKDSYVNAFNMASMPAKCKTNFDKDYFLPFPYFLPQELSYKNIHRMMEECNRKIK